MSTIQEDFDRFHSENPTVYAELRRLALQLVDAGRTRFGIATIYETLRYSRLQTSGDVFKLNNNYRAIYARMLMEREPRLAGVFLTRALTTPEPITEAPGYVSDPETGQVSFR